MPITVCHTQKLAHLWLTKWCIRGSSHRVGGVQGDGSQITVEPGLIGGEVNRLLEGFHKKEKTPIQYKIGPDPSSIDSCMIGGIVANNSSGMCCGVSKNTYHTLKDLRVVFTDGTVLDTADPESREAFKRTHAKTLQHVTDLAQRVQVCTACFEAYELPLCCTCCCANPWKSPGMEFEWSQGACIGCCSCRVCVVSAAADNTRLHASIFHSNECGCF